MRALRCHPFRVIGRLFWLIAELILAALNFVFWGGLSSNCSQTRRALWLQHSSRRIMKIFNTSIQTSGTVPQSGLLVSNHLGYLDVFVISFVTPAIFVSKQEVKSWPVFGWFARMAGTVFADRERRASVGETANEIQAALDEDVLVVLFPEGTSTGGETVLPFKSSLLESAAQQTHPLFAGMIQYELEDGDVSEEVCFWKDMTLVPHLMNLLSKRALHVTLRFTEMRPDGADRKELARQLHSEVLRLKESPGAAMVTH